jgi:hypothetical protein
MGVGGKEGRIKRRKELKGEGRKKEESKNEGIICG